MRSTYIFILLAPLVAMGIATSCNKGEYNPYIGEDPETLISLLESEDALTRIAASDALVLLGEQAIPALMDDWNHGTYHRELIIKEIGSDAVPVLIEQIQTTQDPRQKGIAYNFLTFIGPDAHSALSVVASELDGPDEGFNSYACHALMRIGLPSEAATHSILEVLSGPLPSNSRQNPGQLRAQMIMTLGIVANTGNEEVIRTLRPLVESKTDPPYIISAAYTLLKMGWHPEEMLSILKTMASDDSALFVDRFAAIYAIAWIGDSESMGFLNTIFGQSDPLTMEKIISSLYDSGPPPESVPLLSKALFSSDRTTQFIAILGLMSLGPQAQEALPDMQELHNSSQLHEPNEAALVEAILRMGRSVNN